MRRIKPEPGFPGSGFGIDQNPCASRPLVKGTRALGTRLRFVTERGKNTGPKEIFQPRHRVWKGGGGGGGGGGSGSRVTG